MKEKVYIEYLILNSHQQESLLEELLKIIQPKLLAYCKRMISDQELANDAVQESLLDIYSKLHKLKDHRRFHAWMYQVTHNKCMDQFRKRKPHLYQQWDDEQEFLIESNETKPGEDLDIIHAINQLPQKLKATVTLFYYEGFSVKEIAVILNTPAGTVKSFLFQARQYIKQLMET